MARPKRIRKMINPPHFKGFLPIGLSEESSPVVLNYEEYEAIRLSDFELLGQMEASQIMEISRPTFARIYESARRKVAQAFVGGQPIVFEGGKVYFDSEWYSCRYCGCYFNHPAKDLEVRECALCGSSDVEQFSESSRQNRSGDICVCPQCGEEKEHTPGIPCKNDICAKCSCPMMRKGVPYQHRKGNHHNS